ncbi:succinate receptor 1-like [Lingula anatina]|uniref:Succinate receptor 1-like n=1 Tax=Lingula anatina TaxID=7574 RepID=A0A1S3KFI8_LINAN|nr:succinate receptor 1-like [Lingula anatina]|eukprot:XP_013421252.1 succinate receptor 1-like [Lingula anatina]
MNSDILTVIFDDASWNDSNGFKSLVNGSNRSTPIWDEAERTSAEALLSGSRIGMLPVALLGLIGNLLILILVTRSDVVKKYPLSVYLSALAVGDFIFCLDLLRWYLEWADLIPKDWGDVYCAITNFLGHFAIGLSHWTILCISLDRMVRVAFPFKAKTLLTMKLARIVVVVVVFGVGLPNIPHFVFDHQVPVDNTTWMCWTLQTDTIGPLYYNLMRILIETPPVILVIFVNCITVFKLRSHWSKMKKEGIKENWNQKRGNLHMEETALTVTLVVNGTLFVVLETPYSVTEFVAHYRSTDDISALPYMFATVFKLVSGVDHTCNFFVYIIGSAMMRREFIAMFRCPEKADGTMKTECHTNTIPVIVHPNSVDDDTVASSSFSLSSTNTRL